MGIIISFVSLTFLATLIAYVSNKTSTTMTPEKAREATGVVFAGFTTASIVLTGIIALILVPTSISQANNLKAFYYANAAEYQLAAERLYEGVPEDMTTEQWFDSANLQQIQQYGQGVLDLRDAVAQYNILVVTHRYWQNSFMAGLFYKDLPEDVVTISTAPNK